jgi:hypothetical protein
MRFLLYLRRMFASLQAGVGGPLLLSHESGAAVHQSLGRATDHAEFGHVVVSSEKQGLQFGVDNLDIREHVAIDLDRFLRIADKTGFARGFNQARWSFESWLSSGFSHRLIIIDRSQRRNRPFLPVRAGGNA